MKTTITITAESKLVEYIRHTTTKGQFSQRIEDLLKKGLQAEKARGTMTEEERNRTAIKSFYKSAKVLINAIRENRLTIANATALTLDDMEL